MKDKLYLSLVIVALLSLVGWTGYGQGQRSNPGRQTWEYLVEDAPTNAGPGSYVSPEKAQQLLNQRAAQGWELTAVGGGQGLILLQARQITVKPLFSGANPAPVAKPLL